MRFGRRGKSKSREPIWARRDGGRNDGEPRMDIPTDGSAAPALDMMPDDSEVSTQEILAHLGRFSREWSTPENALWSDACMNQLILCIEIAIEESWSDLTAVLSETARVLQTYENADRPEGSIPFLENAYDVMCRLVGDIVVEKTPHETLELWSKVYNEGLSRIERDGLTLFQDDDDDTAEADVQEFAFVMEDESTMPQSQTHDQKNRDELPVLDELPPLESLVKLYTEPEAIDEVDEAFDLVEEEDSVSLEDLTALADETDTIVVDESSDIEEFIESENTAETELDFTTFEMPRAKGAASLKDDTPIAKDTTTEITTAPEDLKSPESSVESDDDIDVYDPPRIVVDIIDRICDVLGSFESDSHANRADGLEVLMGGVKALAHEARLMENQAGTNACTAMKDASQLVLERESCWSERYLELGFAFCGIFIEALTEPESENVSAWQKECEDWLAETAEVVAEPPVATGVVLSVPEKSPTQPSAEELPSIPKNSEAPASPVAEQVELAPETDSPVPATLISIEPQPEIAGTSIVETPAIVDESEAPESRDTPEASTQEAVAHAEQSQSLLQSAQEAALQGRSEDAKTFALRAAAEIAKSEVHKAEARLRESEMKLKEGMVNVEDARKGVKSCEESVREATALVADSRQSHDEAQSATATVATTLEGLEADVAELNRQIQELQAKRDHEVERIGETMEMLEKTHATEQQAGAELEELRRLENDGRSRLEESRQRVKDKLRGVQQVESEMERARERLTQEKVSYSDITQAIQQITGTIIQKDSGDEGLLF